MALNKPLLSVLQGAISKTVPCWFMRQAGRYLPEYRDVRSSVPDFLSLCYTPKKAAEVTLQPIYRYGMDGAILFSDILVIPDALGQPVRFVEKEGPRLDKITNFKQIDALDVSRTKAHLAPVAETIRRVVPELPDHVTMLGFAGAPWTVVCYMLQGRGKEFSEAIHIARTQPALVAALFEKIIPATISYLQMQIEAGVEALQLFDSWAGLVPDDLFETLVTTPNAMIVAAIRASHPHTPIIGFAKDIGARLTGYTRQLGCQGIGIGMDMTMKQARALVGKDVVLQGNIDPELLATNLPEALKQAHIILEDMRDQPFIFNLGHGMVPHCPPEHLAALMQVIRQE